MTPKEKKELLVELKTFLTQINKLAFSDRGPRADDNLRNRIDEARGIVDALLEPLPKVKRRYFVVGGGKAPEIFYDQQSADFERPLLFSSRKKAIAAAEKDYSMNMHGFHVYPLKED